MTLDYENVKMILQRLSLNEYSEMNISYYITKEKTGDKQMKKQSNLSLITANAKTSNRLIKLSIFLLFTLYFVIWFCLTYTLASELSPLDAQLPTVPEVSPQTQIQAPPSELLAPVLPAPADTDQLPAGSVQTEPLMPEATLPSNGEVQQPVVPVLPEQVAPPVQPNLPTQEQQQQMQQPEQLQDQQALAPQLPQNDQALQPSAAQQAPVTPEQAPIAATAMAEPMQVPVQQPVNTFLITLDRVNLRATASTQGQVLVVLNAGTQIVQVSSEMAAPGWTPVHYYANNIKTEGFIKSEYLGTMEQYQQQAKQQSTKKVELIEWSDAKSIFTVGVPAEVYDVRSGITYYVKSFSNGLHADVEPITKNDTAILKQTFNNRWDWDVRPVWVTINGHTMAASINGMPHGGGINSSNGMDGQVCIHFKGSATHNGNSSFTKEHQNGVMEAFYAGNK